MGQVVKTTEAKKAGKKNGGGGVEILTRKENTLKNVT